MVHEKKRFLYEWNLQSFNTKVNNNNKKNLIKSSLMHVCSNSLTSDELVAVSEHISCV